MALAFLLNRLIFRIVDFFHHWYVDGSQSFGEGVRSIRIFSGRFSPVLGYPLRVLGEAFLGFIYVVWLIMPIFIIYMIFWGQK